MAKEKVAKSEEVNQKELTNQDVIILAEVVQYLTI